MKEIDDSNESPDKRLELYKKMRSELMEEEEKGKQEMQQRKMQELDNKIDKMEASKKEKEKESVVNQSKKKEEESKRGQNNANFLANIQAFDVVEDF